jgi:hypothetical protein
MRRFYRLLPWILFIIVCLFYYNSCQNKKGAAENIVPIVVSEQTGKFDAVKPDQKIVRQKPAGQNLSKTLASEDLSLSDEQIAKDLLIDKLLCQNDSLSKAFSEIENDSAKTAKYNQANAIREYKHTFEDTAVKINIGGLVRGEIQSMSCDWKVKERTVPAQIKTWRILGGVELGSTQALDRFGAKANFRYQSAKDNLYSIGFDNTKMIWVGYDMPIFKRTRVKTLQKP